jgi:hypothetical protein
MIHLKFKFIHNFASLYVLITDRGDCKSKMLVPTGGLSGKCLNLYDFADFAIPPTI